MSPTTSSVAQNLFYAQNQLIDITYIQKLSTFFKYYNILKRKKEALKASFLFLAKISLSALNRKFYRRHRQGPAQCSRFHSSPGQWMR